jgi:hypothetical protein
VVKNVIISFADTQTATAAATASQDTTDFTTALADAGIVAVVEVREAVDVSVELTFRVTADATIEVTVTDLESAVSSATNGAVTPTAEITSAVAVTYTRMPCSESDICDGSSWEPKTDSATIGCDGETCTAEETDRCCTRATIGQTGNAQGTCVLGSVFALLSWHLTL